MGILVAIQPGGLGLPKVYILSTQTIIEPGHCTLEHAHSKDECARQAAPSHNL